MSSRYLTLRTWDGLELPARLRRPAAAAAGAVVLCHPHPAFGGSMDVWLLPTLAERLAANGWVVLRFNFRPDVGDGADAVPDVAAAVHAAVAAAEGGKRVAIVGWSLGALVGLLHGPTDPRVTDWVGIAPPSRPMPDGWAARPLAPVPPGLERWRARRAVVVGSEEQYYPASDAPVFAADNLMIVPGADHFFFDRDDEVAELVATWLGRP